ncbi:hypothetical protein PAECIP111893_05042 [Paenibacillus plantiphilus]|uniref:Uncharacterized protein n=1 Tax=Paenibacillus plantiphilus TaxID=2905650 RepID=A0ABM9CVB0_9BACL|nr:hypothetical protein PAECIP111893_05042 [Paenibacillus plantiphilus]
MGNYVEFKPIFSGNLSFYVAMVTENNDFSMIKSH